VKVLGQQMSVTNYVHKTWYIFCSKNEIIVKMNTVLYKIVLLQKLLSTDTYFTILTFVTFKILTTDFIHHVALYYIKKQKYTETQKNSIYRHLYFKANIGGTWVAL
jgi:hypothetical protein